MSKITRKEVCECVNCGNEAEMVITCKLEDAQETVVTKPDDDTARKQVKGTGTCSHCGNEADMWIDL